MKIAFDISPIAHTKLSGHRVRGIGFYTESLKAALLRYYPLNSYTFFTHISQIPAGVDLIHYPYFEPFFLSLHLHPRSKTVVTVHDLTPIVFPDFFPRGIKGSVKWQLQKRRLQNADGVITDSQCSKIDIEKHTNIMASKITSVYIAASEAFKRIENVSVLSAVRKKYNLPKAFILYVGDVTWNKNLPRLIRAVTTLRIPLVMVGSALVEKDFDRSNPWNLDRITAQKLAEGNPFICRLGFVPLSDLVALYNTATVFVMPSLHEGFGLPALEAMQCGTPVIVSKRGSLPEVVGNAGYYVDAESEENIAVGIHTVVSDVNLQKNLRRAGIQQAQKFSWEKACKETMSVYEQTIKKI